MTSKQVLNRREGFWNTGKGSALPDPIENNEPWPGQAEFLKALTAVEGQAEKEAYRGVSMCRVCKRVNGSVTYISGGWEWPSGFAHYVKEHNVRPSLAFIEFITQEEIK